MTSNERMNQRAVISRLRFFVPIAIRPLCLFVAVAALALVQLTPPASAATFAVNSTADAMDAAPGNGACATAGAVCTLRAAVQEANALTGADTITVPAGAYSLTIVGASEDASATGDLDLTADVTITGAGAGATVIDATALGNDRVLHVPGGVTAQVSGVTISGGASVDAGGIYNSGDITLSNSTVSGNSASNAGGGIRNSGDVTLSNTTISGNSAGNGGGIYNVAGSTLTINNSTISGNSVTGGGTGGGIANSGDITLSNSTISGNSAAYGGGIYTFSLITLRINNGTISGNSASNSGGGIYNSSGIVALNNGTISGNSATVSAGGIYTSGASTSTLKNTILANGAGGNCTGAINSHGYNLSSDASCAPSGTGDQNSTDPMLGPLANNGGPTQTHALLEFSPAIDAGFCTDTSLSPVTADQRGVLRPQGATCDIGAFEAGVPGLDLFETTSSSLSFAALPLPTGFFGPGSDPFTGTVSLKGQPIAPADWGTADTRVRRRDAPALPDPLPSTGTVPIEIVQLSLVSTNPITVTYSGGGSPEPWNVAVGLSPVTQPVGTMAITKQNASGGTFDATLPVRPRVTFTRLSPPATLTLDGPTLTFNESGGPWRYTCPPIVLVVPGSSPDYCAGTDGIVRVSTTWTIPSVGQSLMLPACADADGDVVCTTLDNCPATANANQANADGDSLGNVCDPCANDMANDADLDGICVGAGFMLPNQGGNDNCPTVANTGQQNADGDPWGDACDGCPSTVTAWATPLGDADCDAFPSFTYDPGTNRASEFFFLGTDPGDACADTTTPNDERGQTFSEPVSPWPMDNNDDRKAALGDILGYIPVFGTTGPGLPYKARYDLNADNKIGLSDILMFIPFFNITCTP